MYEFLAYGLIAVAGIIFDRLMGHQKPRDRANFPKGLETEKRGLLIISFVGFSVFVTLLGGEHSVERWTFAQLSSLLFLARTFLFEEWYYGFKDYKR
jgi:hypothetical protein